MEEPKIRRTPPKKYNKEDQVKDASKGASTFV
jgi:hypothetical protein